MVSKAKKTTNLIQAFVFNVAPGTDEKDFSKHYEEHIQAILSTGAYHTATRYEATGLVEAGQPRFLTIYESEISDGKLLTETFRKGNERLKAEGRVPPQAAMQRVWSIQYKKLTVKNAE